MQGKLTKKKELEAKTFARLLPQNDFNGTKTMKEIKPNISYEAQRTTASRMYANDNTREVILKELEKIGVDNEFITRVHKRNVSQDENFAASNAAIDMLYKIKGTYPKEDNPQQHLHIHLSDNELKEKIQELTKSIGSN